MSKSMNIENVPAGTFFTYLGVNYRCVRQTGQVIDMANRNQWGRSVGGTHKAHKVCVTVDKRHRGWSRPHYTAFRLGAVVHIVDTEVATPSEV